MVLAFFSGGEILLIFLVVLLLFGAKRLPEIARSMGKAMNEFKKAKDEIVNPTEVNNQPQQQPPQQQAPPPQQPAQPAAAQPQQNPQEPPQSTSQTK